jgi:hypothetical protein
MFVDTWAALRCHSCRATPAVQNMHAGDETRRRSRQSRDRLENCSVLGSMAAEFSPTLLCSVASILRARTEERSPGWHAAICKADWLIKSLAYDEGQNRVRRRRRYADVRRRARRWWLYCTETERPSFASPVSKPGRFLSLFPLSSIYSPFFHHAA